VNYPIATENVCATSNKTSWGEDCLPRTLIIVIAFLSMVFPPHNPSRCVIVTVVFIMVAIVFVTVFGLRSTQVRSSDSSKSRMWSSRWS
jgi:hypothetical protein